MILQNMYEPGGVGSWIIDWVEPGLGPSIRLDNQGWPGQPTLDSESQVGLLFKIYEQRTRKYKLYLNKR